MRRHPHRGVTLIDTIVGTALMLVIFVGIASAFNLGVDVVTNNKARAGAIALANERMEYLRSLPYSSLGVVGGIPSGNVPQTETLSFNGVAYTRRTLIVYVDDPKDGTGAADANGITEDYKAAKVDVSWVSRTGVRDIILVGRFETPSGMETTCTPPCGTLTINAVNAAGQAVPSAQVTITNTSSSPAISLTTYTNASGTAQLIGAPAATNYSIVVTKSGYSTAQTYSATAQNTNPSPGNLTVSNNQTTAGTFAIDQLAQLTVNSFTAMQYGTTTDTFADSSQVATSSNVSIAAGSATLDTGKTSGEIQSTGFTPANLNTWKILSFTDTRPAGSSIVYRLYDGSGNTLIPDTQLPGNSAGFTSGPINLSGISTSTYSALRIDAQMTANASAPSIDAWNLSYTYGPTPLPNLAFTLTGTKTIGSGPSGTVYKYNVAQSTTGTGILLIPGLEWDSYTESVASTTGYDIAASCTPQPISLSPGAAVSSRLYLLPHTANSLLVDVRASASGVYLSGATTTLSATGYSVTTVTDSCGQAFFSGVPSGSQYTVTVDYPGFTTSTTANQTVSGQTRLSVAL